MGCPGQTLRKLSVRQLTEFGGNSKPSSIGIYLQMI